MCLSYQTDWPLLQEWLDLCAFPQGTQEISWHTDILNTNWLSEIKWMSKWINKIIRTKVQALGRGNLDLLILLPHLAFGIFFPSSRSLQRASIMGTRKFRENLSFREGADHSLWVCPGIQGPTERSCREHLQNDLWGGEVDTAPAQVHKGR